MKEHSLLAVIFGCCVGTAAHAAQKGYVCELSNLGEGFVASPVVFLVDTEKATAIVNDPIIHYVYEAPLKGDMKIRDDGRYQIALAC